MDLDRAEKILNRDHYGMEKVKARFLETLAVRKLSDRATGQIICLVGPPGVGKTSIARSIAEATGRKYVRVSLWRRARQADASRCRRTYVGSMPGRIMAAVKQAGTNNPPHPAR
ncbi:AAA family ATPase [Hominenteromicrobium sp.]|uniref:AAA family ATPase n=1 Tax=Hominenteromicrobium sp. TaxID=3073581 RepID=UPI003999ACE5